MNENLLRFLMMGGFISLALGLAAIGGELSSYSFADPFESYYPMVEYRNVSQLLADMPLDKQVSVSGTISKIEEDHTSQKGYEYQQFFISDGAKEIKVFCSKFQGPIDIEIGDQVSLSGKFQKYYNTLEIYTECRNIEKI
jgi:hypothetical protein